MTLFSEALDKSTWELQAKGVMTQVCEFYTVNNIVENSGMFLQVSGV